MNINLIILELMIEIMPEDISYGFWQLEYVLRFIMVNPESINNLNRNVYSHVAREFNSNPECVEKNISRLIPLIDIEKLSTITGMEMDVKSLTPAKLIRYLIIHIRRITYIS